MLKSKFLVEISCSAAFVFTKGSGKALTALPGVSVVHGYDVTFLPLGFGWIANPVNSSPFEVTTMPIITILNFANQPTTRVVLFLSLSINE